MKWKSSLNIFLCLVLTGCGFHLQNAGDFPASLHVLAFKSDNVYQGITAELERQLTANRVQLDPHANILLTLKDSHFSTAVPVIFASSSAQIYSYSLSVNVFLERDHKNLIQTTISAAKNITYNVNQIGTPVVTPLMRERLSADVVDQIYAFLKSTGVQQLLKQNHGH